MQLIQILTIVIAVLYSLPVWAAPCSWSGNTGTVASPYAVADVQDCIDNGTSDDAESKTGEVIIQIPNCTVTHSGTITVNMSSGWANVTKLTIKGENDCTTTNTTLMVPSGNNFPYPTSCGTNIANFTLNYTGIEGKAFRLSNFRITGTSGINIYGNGKSWRFDYLFWDTVAGAHSNRIIWIDNDAGNNGYVTDGVIDHNYAIITTNASFLYFWVMGNSEWTASYGLGTSSGVFVENCKITYPTPGSDSTISDETSSGRTVTRYCELTNAWFSGHADGQFGAWYRGARKAETYGNYIDLSESGNYFLTNWLPNGVMFNNTIVGQSYFAVQVRRVSQSGHIGECNVNSGNNYYNSNGTYPAAAYNCTLGVNGCVKADGTSSNPSGYPCRDQFGWDQAANGSMQLAPFLLWGNTIDGASVNPTPSNKDPLDDPYVQENREWCKMTSCSGTSCSGMCGSTSVNYTAYTFPHPLIGGDSTPSSVRGLTIQGGTFK